MEAIILFSLLLCLQFSFSISNDTITMNQIFKDGDLLISEGKNFALGFFSPGSSSYRYLGIWFHKVPLQTVVWVANRNNPINGSSGFLTINQQLGNLVLYSNNDPVWSTNVSMEAGDTWEAKLLNSGNMIFVGRNNRLVWQSFEHPTNTLLLGMKVGLNKKTGRNTFLTSWRSESDPGTGNYSYRVKPNGSPQFFINNGAEHYWRSAPWPWKSFSKVYLCDFVNDDEIYHNCSLSDSSIITMLVLGETGFLKRLTWHESDGQWKQFSSFPMDNCDIYGRCGAYGKCDFNTNTVDRLGCSCFPGYEPKSPKDWQIRDGSGGCVRKRLDSSSICGNGEGFIKVESVKLPDSSAAVWVGMNMSRMDCELDCRRNCTCTAYFSVDNTNGNGTKCLAWYGELIDTRTYLAGIGYDLYVRVDTLELANSVRRSSSPLAKKEILASLITFVASTWLVVIVIIYRCAKKKKGKKKTRKGRISPKNISATNELEEGSRRHQDLIYFHFSTLLAATDNFSSYNKIGQGGFGAVYKGQLSNGQEIAVKRMCKFSRQGIKEFKNEVMLIAKLQHKNLVKILGWCSKRKEQLLIYEYCSNKSLDSFLSDEKRSLIDWDSRMDIIIGIARGMLYLHQDSRLTIIHRDLKCSNILLDAKMNPKISDFGMARTCNGDQVEGRTNRIAGTYGYMSPEYAYFGKFSVKSDVFSFGIILLEVVSGKKSNTFHQEDPALSFIGKVWELWSEGRAMEIIDSSLTDSYNSNEALRFIQVGLLCVQEYAMDRPTMSEVILMLKSETPLPYPKHPAFIFNTSSTQLPEGQTCSVNEITMSAVKCR